MDEQLREQLLAMPIKAFKEFSFNGYITIAKVLRVHDPDTMTIGFMYSDLFYKKNLRLAKIDAPELHSKVVKEAKLCRLGKAYLDNNYLNKLIKVEMGTMDKYGRILANIYDIDTEECINTKLLECKFVREYGVAAGSKSLHKDTWTDCELDAGIETAYRMNLCDPRE